MAIFNKVNKDRLSPQHPQHDQLEWIEAYTYRCIASGIFNNKYEVNLQGDLLFEVSCAATFIERLVGMLNGAYNIGRSHMKLEFMVDQRG